MDNFAIALEDGLAHDLAAIDIADVVTNHSPLAGGCLFGGAREANLDDTSDAIAERGRSHSVDDLGVLEHIGHTNIVTEFVTPRQCPIQQERNARRPRLQG